MDCDLPFAQRFAGSFGKYALDLRDNRQRDFLRGFGDKIATGRREESGIDRDADAARSFERRREVRAVGCKAVIRPESVCSGMVARAIPRRIS